MPIVVIKFHLPSKSFVKDIIDPLVNLNLIETEKTTSRRRAKPNQLVGDLIQTIANLTNISDT